MKTYLLIAACLIGAVLAGPLTAQVLLKGHVEKELHDDRAVLCEVPFEVANRFEALAPNRFEIEIGKPLTLEELRVDADDQHLFVVAAVEDADAAALR